MYSHENIPMNYSYNEKYYRQNLSRKSKQILKKYVQSRIYLNELFLEWEILQAKFVQKIKIQILFPIISFFRKYYRLWDKVKNCDRVVQGTDDNIIRSMRIECWTTKAINTHSEYVGLENFPGNDGYRNAHGC